MRVQFDRRELPIVRSGDVVVVGGSMAGIAAAVEFTRAGQQVVLIEPRTYLGREITATLRPWISHTGRPLPDWFAELVVSATLHGRDIASVGEVVLHLDRLKIGLEDVLLGAGVQLLYASMPVGLVAPDGDLRGIIIGNKSGRQIVTGTMVIDATETALVARLAGTRFEAERSELFRFRRTLEFDHVQPLAEMRLWVPSELGVFGNSVILHAGYAGPGHLYVECEFDLQPYRIGLAETMQREIEARHRTMRLASYLIADVPEFARAHLAATSFELHGRHTSRMAESPLMRPGVLDVVPNEVTTEDSVALPLTAFATPLGGLWTLQEAARLSESELALFAEPGAASMIGAAFARTILTNQHNLSGGHNVAESAPPLPISGVSAPSLTDTSQMLIVKEPDSPQRGRLYDRQAIPPASVPVFESADVLVVGGGSSGATAAMVAGQEGMKTVLVDLNPGLGGTGTFGAVDSYWAGRVVAFSERVQRLVDDVHEGLNYTKRVWNVEAKMYALLAETVRDGVDVFFNAVTIGAVMDGNHVRGVVVATRFGPIALLADVTIDATGDGDVAAFAGAEYVYGSARDHIVMWYSLAQFKRPGRSHNNFTSMVDVSNIEDYTRAILAGRRRGKETHDHGIYVASRETRHIRGDTTLSLTDILLQRQWPDVVNIHFANYDIKGKSGADWLLLGLIPPNLEVEVPYRSLLPHGLEGILVAGKAISATHDALPGIRMQADMENLGGVAGLAAAIAVRTGGTPRRIDVCALQQRLIAERLLPAEVLGRTISRRAATEADLAALVQRLDADRALHAYSDMRLTEVFRGEIPLVQVCTAGPRIIPFLEEALASSTGDRQVLIAQALAMYESKAGVPVLIERIQDVLARGVLPARDSFIRNSNLAPPNQGAMPDVVYLVYSLGMARDRRSLAVWARIVELLDFTEEDMHDFYRAPFFYVDSVCFGAERLGDPAAIPILEQLHTHPCLRDQVCLDGFQVDYIQERKAMLELAIGRALARCGSPHGIEVLIAYLDDNRALLAEQAHSELLQISGESLGKGLGRLAQWLQRARPSLKPCPVWERFDLDYEKEV